MLKILRRGLKLELLSKEKSRLFLALLRMRKVIKLPKNIPLNKKDHQSVIFIYRPKLRESKIDLPTKKVINPDPAPKMPEEKAQYYLIRAKPAQQRSTLMTKISSKRSNRVQRFK